MISIRQSAGYLIVAAIAAGTLSDRPQTRNPVNLGGYRVLAADFHVHTFPLSASTLAPWDLIFEARRQGLDAMAITGHNQTLAGRVGEWFARHTDGPIVLVGEEIHAPQYHMIAVGIRNTISWRLGAASAIDEVHRQGGVAIAAHPVEQFWPAFDADALRKLDATEVLQPAAYSSETARLQLEEFYNRRRFTAIGSSDYHGPGPLGLCRTYVFAREASAEGIVDALRDGRTVVFNGNRAYGDPALIPVARENRRLIEPAAETSGRAFGAVLSRVCGVLGLLLLICSGFPD